MAINNWLWWKIKTSLSRFVPLHINDPFGLVKRMLASRNSAAVFTLLLTALGIALTPVDKVLGLIERRRLSSNSGNGPHIIICGPARSGTTLVFQVLAAELPVEYIRNFTVLFPLSPILASKLFGRSNDDKHKIKYNNYYGKTAGFQEPNEANHLWNQWVDADQSGFRTILGKSGANAMARFFGQLSGIRNRATLSKNNNVNAFADDVAHHLDNCWFICLRRDTRYLAQSLLTARMEINGNINQSYGVTEEGHRPEHGDPVEAVLEQIRYLDHLAIKQQTTIGEDKFWIIDYEMFCRDPAALVNRVKSLILNIDTSESANLDPIRNNNRITNSVLFHTIQTALGQPSSADQHLSELSLDIKSANEHFFKSGKQIE